MFVIQNKQIEEFKNLALKKFEDEMVDHIKESFPNHFIMIQENGIRDTIRYGYIRAKNYGFTTKRNVCLYINKMMVLGSNFDCDPQYPWAQMILNENTEYNPGLRIDRLSDKTLDTMSQIAGSRQEYLNRALLNIHNNANELFERLMSIGFKGPLHYLNTLFPQKFEVIGEYNLHQMIKYGIDNANKYGIRHESSRLIYFVCMFLMGSGFDRDPQFSWAKEILTDLSITNQTKRVELLYHKVINSVRSFIFTNNN